MALASGRHDKVIPQLPTLLVIDQIDAGINLLVSDLGVSPRVLHPLRGVIAKKVAGLAAEFIGTLTAALAFAPTSFILRTESLVVGPCSLDAIEGRVSNFEFRVSVVSIVLCLPPSAFLTSNTAPSPVRNSPYPRPRAKNFTWGIGLAGVSLKAEG